MKTVEEMIVYLEDNCPELINSPEMLKAMKQWSDGIDEMHLNEAEPLTGENLPSGTPYRLSRE